MSIQDGAKRVEIIDKIKEILGDHVSLLDGEELATRIYDEAVLPEILEATTSLANALREGMQEIWWGAT